MSLTTGTAWRDGVRVIRDGEPVSAATANRPTSDLTARDDYLKALLDALHGGEALYLRQRAVAPGCVAGMAVYFDADNSQFAPALAAEGDAGALADSANVVGVVAYKHSATVADLVTAGSVKLPPEAVENPGASGQRYVSAATAGYLTATRPAIAVPVGQWLAEYGCLVVQPSARSDQDGHTHYRFKLCTTPAGTANSPAFMDRHAIAAADPGKPGWLPADHPIFGGTAPAGAKFGYNLPRHPELFSVFPPAPLAAAYLEAYLDGAGAGREVGTVAQITAGGIWWMRDDWGWAPWALDLSSLDTDPASVVTPPDRAPPVELQHGHGYVSDAGAQDCPFSLYLWFSRPTHHTDRAVVLSLTVKDGAPLTLTDCAGKPATSGHLTLGLDMKLQSDGDAHPGHVVVKEMDGVRVRRGPVVSGVRSASSSIRVVSADGLVPDDEGYYPGRVWFDFQDPSTAARELDVQLFALDGATEERYSGMFYLGFPPGRRTGVRGRVDIPEHNMPDGNIQVALRLRMLGTAAGTWPALQMSYRRLPATDTPAALPEAGSEVALAAVQPGGSLPSGNMYFDCTTAPMTTRAGETLMFTLQRQVDAYPGIVGVVRARGRIG